jgi:phosphohistidine phosphatase SixA
VEEAVSGLSRGPGDHDNHVLLVSHQPLVGELINHWLGEPHPESAMLPGAFVVLDLPVVAPGFATLELAGSPPNYQMA